MSMGLEAEDTEEGAEPLATGAATAAGQGETTRVGGRQVRGSAGCGGTLAAPQLPSPSQRP